MKLARRNFLRLAASAATLPTVSRFAWAQTYPTRPVTMIVPYPAGGPTDTLARILSEHMRISLGQSIDRYDRHVCITLWARAAML